MDEVSSFSIAVPDRDLDDLTDRLHRTRWPDRETVADRSQGVPLDSARGGHFGAWEQPETFVEEIRAGFRAIVPR